MLIKSPAECSTVSLLLAMGMRMVDPEHAITRHTSLVYWPGGERTVEDVLFRKGSFDRIVVWGSPDTVRSVGQRVEGTKTIFLNPRFGASLIDLDAQSCEFDNIAQRACTDSLIANQQACTSSLVHYVIGSDTQARDYCSTLQRVLARWDERIPHSLPRSTQGELRLLRRSAWLSGTWFVNGAPGAISSAVVYLPHPFDVSSCPQSRVIVVRRIERAEEILQFLGPTVSTLGVYPEALRIWLRDAAAAAGVSNLFPLGEAERAYAGMPHDGMRILSELVNWVNSSQSGDS
jgi:hypothetical protein